MKRKVGNKESKSKRRVEEKREEIKGVEKRQGNL